MLSIFLTVIVISCMNNGSLCVYCHKSLPRIAIATTIISVPEANTSNFDAIQMQGAGVDLGMKHLKNTYGEIFNFSHTYLMDKTRPEAILLWDDVENFVAKFYYQNAGQVEGMALLSPCALENIIAVKLTKAFRMLHGCSVSGGFEQPSNIQHFSLSIYQSPIMFALVTLLLKENNWSTLAGLIDSSSIAREYVSRGLHSRFVKSFSGADPAFNHIQYHGLTYESNKGYLEVERVLQQMSQVSRIIFLFGSGKSSMMVLRTAEKFGMTNGDYVFFMVTLDRWGLSPDNRDDTWWKVTDKNADTDIPDRGCVSKSAIVLSYISPYKVESGQEIREKIIEIARSKYNFYYQNNKVPAFLYTAYEEYVIYGIILNETYTSMGRVLNGLEMGSYIRNRTFFLPTSKVSVGPDGLRLGNVLGEIVDPKTGQYTSSFLYDHEQKHLYTLSLIGKMWPNGKWPPMNEPACGFMGNRCPDGTDGMLWIIAGCTCGIFLLTVISAYFLWRALRYKLVIFPSNWWRITEQLNLRSTSDWLHGIRSI